MEKILEALRDVDDRIRVKHKEVIDLGSQIGELKEKYENSQEEIYQLIDRSEALSNLLGDYEPEEGAKEDEAKPTGY